MNKQIVPIVLDSRGKPVVACLVFLQTDKYICAFNTTDPSGAAELSVDSRLTDSQFSILAAGYKPYSCHVKLNEGNQQIRVGLAADPARPQDIILESLTDYLLPVWRPTREQIENFAGAFIIPNVYTDCPYGDGKRIWTPALLALSEAWQDRWIADYKKRTQYTHMVINLGCLKTYHDDYPPIPDNPELARKLILKLLANKLIPVVCATDDGNPDVLLQSYVQNVDIIDCMFVMWEMNGPCEGDSDRMFRITKAACDVGSEIKVKMIHFTSGHGSMGEPESDWWVKCAAIGIRGLFSQDNGYDRIPYGPDKGDPIGTAAGLEDTARHFRGEVAGWEGLNLLDVRFEQITTPLYHDGWTEQDQLDYGARIGKLSPHSAGYMDGSL